jgi:hypothetical protein
MVRLWRLGVFDVAKRLVEEPKDWQSGLDGIAVFAAISTLVVDESSLHLLDPTVRPEVAAQPFRQ